MAELKDLSNAIRFLSADAIEKSKSGHPGMPLGISDVATVLFTKFLKFDAKNPRWADRDRFVLSAGHGSMLLYSLLYLNGYPDAGIDDIKNFRQLGSKMAGHPEYGHLEGIENTSGPLGQGIAMAVGMAIAERMQAARFKDLVDHYTYVICGDGCLMEGISEEAISIAGHFKLNKLIVLWDDNKITIDGRTTLATSTDQAARFTANGWNVVKVDDGHDFAKIEAAIAKAKQSRDRPTMIAFNTIIGKGAPTKQGTSKTHGSPLGGEELAAMRRNLDWPHEAFVVPEEILSAWRANGARSAAVREEWQKKADADAKFTEMSKGLLFGDSFKTVLAGAKEDWLKEKPKVATRKASEMVLAKIVPGIGALVGGSSDLTASNLPNPAGMKDVGADDFSGNYINYGIREHAMGAIMNGLALHGGFIPYSGAFMVFADYLRPAVRMAALMQIRAIYVLTHDSIGVGEDGPTHQPIEHLASFRAMPNVLVFRPCDVIETAEAYEIAIENAKRPSIMALSRQNLPTLRSAADKNLTALGGYVISEAKDKRKATIIATGSEVDLALQAQKHLWEKGIDTAVVSMPCFELFDSQDRAYKAKVLGDAPRIGVEALIKFGWEKYIGEGEFIGMNSFGSSGPAEKLYQHFNITALAVVDAVLKSV